jgi:hypothetical protein
VRPRLYGTQFRGLPDIIVISTTVRQLRFVPHMESGNCPRCLIPLPSSSKGDKSNHIAGINLPQLLYCGTFIAAFSAPVILSFALIRRLILYPFSSFSKAVKVGVFLAFLLILVHYNTQGPHFHRGEPY